jgi:UDP-2,4-diacetamido-2,4,6-trideoxy-beta-L-altropyranose hydrolase
MAGVGTEAFSIAFRTDAGIAMGSGHLIRCSALAFAMAARGWRTTLYGTTETLALASTLEGFSTAVPLSPSIALDPRAIDPEHDLIVIDHYGIPDSYAAEARQRVGALLIFRDYLGEYTPCDLLVDQNLGRKATDYADFIEPDCNVLAGSDYVLLRPAFRRVFPGTLLPARGEARNLLVTLGASDPDDATSMLLRELRPIAAPHWRIRVVLGPSYAHGIAITRMARDWPALEIASAPPDLVASMRWADAAITAPGGTCWELCYMGVPFAVANIARAANTNARQLEKCGAAIDLGAVQTMKGGVLRDALVMLMGPCEARQAMADRASSLVDGLGVDRVCHQIERRLCGR